MIASIKKISTTADGGFVVSFDVPESEVAEIVKLYPKRQREIKLIVEG